MSSLVLPRNLVENDFEDPDFDAWRADLPHIVPEIAERWSLRLGEPYQPGGMCSWVAPATDRDGRRLAVKIGWWHFEGEHEADGLRFWDGDGAVVLHDQIQQGRTNALLLERCEPGTTLLESLPHEEQDVVVAGLLRRLWRKPGGGHPFRTLKVMCDAWAEEFDEKLERAPGHIDTGLARDGMELFRSLPTTATDEVLLCTDLHAENILAAEREPWLVVDPKPTIGDPTYDPLQHMLNEDDRLIQDPDGLVQRMAGLLDLDADRLRLWTFARCVQECFDMPHLRPVAKQLAPS